MNGPKRARGLEGSFEHRLARAAGLSSRVAKPRVHGTQTSAGAFFPCYALTQERGIDSGWPNYENPLSHRSGTRDTCGERVREKRVGDPETLIAPNWSRILSHSPPLLACEFPDSHQLQLLLPIAYAFVFLLFLFTSFIIFVTLVFFFSFLGDFSLSICF